MLAFLSLPGGSEWIVILFIALLVFGSRLPSVMRSLARSIMGFKHELRRAKEDLESEDEEEPAERKPPASADSDSSRTPQDKQP